MKMLRFVLLALLALAVPASAQVPGAAAVVQPKIVVQAVSTGGIELAAWSADSKFVFTASGRKRELLVWDIERGVLVDRLRLPSDGKSVSEFMNLHSMQLLPDRRTLRIEGDVVRGMDSIYMTAKRTYLADIITRSVTTTRSRPTPGATVAGDMLYGLVRMMDGFSTATGARPPDTNLGQIELPPLPRSPDGRWTMVRTGPAFAVRGGDGQLRAMKVNQALASIADADLSPDDRRLAIMSMDGDRLRNDGKSTPVDVIDITDGHMFPRVELAGNYDKVRWITAQQYAALPLIYGNDNARLPPVKLVEAASGTVIGSAPALCHMTVLPGSGLVGSGLANCVEDASPGPALARLVGDTWQALPGFAPARGTSVEMIAASPIGDQLAVILSLPDGRNVIRLVNAATGATTASLPLDKAAIGMLMVFSPDGGKLWLAGGLDNSGNSAVTEWTPGSPPGPDGKPVLRLFPAPTLLPSRMVSRGNHLLIGGGYEEAIRVVDLKSGAALNSIGFPGAAAVGYMKSRPILWAAGTTDGLRLWDQRTGKVLMTISLLPDQRHVVVAADGRYDTNLGPDSETFRWFMPDEPFQSLAPQTLMRDYYEPNLIAKLMDCTMAGNCASVLHPLPPVAGLNRLLPVVRITDIRHADTPGQVVVRVEARETRDAQTGKRSGLFNVKLLLDNRQIDQQPPHFQQQASPTLAQWQELNQMEGIDAAGLWSSDFQVSVPTHHDAKPMEFAAYAFNSDRVKSDTARRSWTPPATSTPKRPRRAWVLTIGVDDYVEPRLKLNFAVADARVIAERLAAIPGYEMRHINLTSAPAADGRPARQVTRADVLGVLSFLAGFPPEMKQMIRLEDVHKVRNLAETSPDDIVIISFSGHGFATASGQFALLPSNARWPATALAPETRSVITAEDITIQLGFMKAAEIAFIIDACHSGAAVNTPDFKPGPMGDASLGQLAFDKGLRILAATQADDVALENAALKQGFLTAALGEGLTDTGGPADLNSDGRIVLDEWLRYAVARLPSLHEDLARGGGTMAARGVRLVMRTPTAKPRIQEPSLFDFNSAPSPVVLRGRATQ